MATQAKALLTDVEVNEVSMVDRAANKRRFLCAKNADGQSTPVDSNPAPTPDQGSGNPAPPAEPVDKAKWTTAYINDLPDSAFLYIEDGGEKDEEGKTKPRSLRHFPVKDADGKVDLDHVRDALSRIPQSDLSDDVKTKCTDKAQKMLDKAEGKDDTKKSDVEKRGAKMAKERLDRLKNVASELAKILSELDDEIDAEGGDTGGDAGAADKVAKSAEPDPLEAKLAELTQQVAALLAKSDAQAQEIASQKAAIAKQAEVIKAAKMPAPPNSSTPEPVAKSGKPFAWPDDLNEERT